MKKRMILLARLTIMIFYLALGTHCHSGAKKGVIEEYTIKPNKEFVIYGVDVKKILRSNFSEIEKILNCKTEIDREVSVIFITKRKDFVSKSIMTRIKDYIDIVYGPVEDTNNYEKYNNIIPFSMIYYAGLNINENINTKNTIIEELKKNLPDNETTRGVLNNIKSTFITGNYRKDMGVIKIKFDMPQYPIAEFYVGYDDKNEIFYRYNFSRNNEIYP
jgi:hypothetical protein